MNKKKAQRIHAKNRARQRYGISLNRDDLFAIVRMIQSNPQPDGVSFLEKKSNRISTYQVKYMNHNLVIAYDKERKSIASFLPADAEEVKHAELNKDKIFYITSLMTDARCITNERGEIVGWQGETCLVYNFFKEQDKLPEHRRQKLCMISCPCSRCSPGRL